MTASKRDQELARQRAERSAARRTEQTRRARRRYVVLGSVVGVLVVLAVVAVLASTLKGSGTDAATAPLPAPAAGTGAPSAAGTPSPGATPAAAGSCAYTKTVEKASRPVEPPPTTDIEKSQPYTATMKTNRGTVTFSLTSAAAPCTVNNFRSLAHYKYFDDTPCHRLTTSGIFVLQCGDPTGEGTGGPGYRFADENLQGATYPRGTVAMANGGPGTNGSQFFLVYKDTQLPADYTPFGRITSGLDVLDAVAAAGSTPSGDGKPNSALTIQSLRTAPARS